MHLGISQNMELEEINYRSYRKNIEHFLERDKWLTLL